MEVSKNTGILYNFGFSMIFLFRFPTLLGVDRLSLAVISRIVTIEFMTQRERLKLPSML